MEKTAAFDVDFEGWEVLPEDGMLSIYGKGEGRRSSLPKETEGVTPKGAAQMDYFPNDQLLVESMDDSMSKAKQQASVDTGANWPAAGAGVVDKLYPDEKIVTEVPPPLLPPAEEAPVFPTSPKKFQDCYGGMNSEEQEKEGEEEKSLIRDDGLVAEEKYVLATNDEKEKGWLEGFGFNIWRWRFTGIGALCSIGVAAATICVFILGGRQRHKQQHQVEKMQFQIYTEDKKSDRSVFSIMPEPKANCTTRLKVKPGDFSLQGSATSGEGQHIFWWLL